MQGAESHKKYFARKIQVPSPTWACLSSNAIRATAMKRSEKSGCQKVEDMPLDFFLIFFLDFFLVLLHFFNEDEK